jgi:hypothetical protein
MSVFYPNAGTLAIAALVDTALASSKLRLFQSSITPSVLTTRTQLVAAEADFSGYAEKTITSPLDPILNPLGGASIQIPTQQFEYDSGLGSVANDVGGWWIETAAGTLIAVGTFASPIPMSADGQGIPIDILLRFGSGL